MGDKISEVFTTAYVDVSQNLVVGKPGGSAAAGYDTGALYWNTHWFGPGERRGWGEGQEGGAGRD